MIHAFSSFTVAALISFSTVIILIQPCVWLRIEHGPPLNFDRSLYFVLQRFVPIGLDPASDPTWPCSPMEER